MSTRGRWRENAAGQAIATNRAEMGGVVFAGGVTRLEARFQTGVTRLVAALLEALPGLVSEQEYRRSMSQLAGALRAAAAFLDQAAGAEQVAHGGIPVMAGAAPARLNAAQIEIMRLLDGGLGPREVAQRLHLARSTVYWRLGQVSKLMGTHSYDASLLVAREWGLLNGSGNGDTTEDGEVS